MNQEVSMGGLKIYINVDCSISNTYIAQSFGLCIQVSGEYRRIYK